MNVGAYLYSRLSQGYRSKQIIGRNCRFLQGKATSPEAVKAIRDAVDTGSDITQLVLNYTSECRPFMNLLTMIALRDVSGQLTYFIGGQTDITSVITGDGLLSLTRTGDDLLNTTQNDFSPGVRLEARESATTSPQTTSPVITIPSPPSTPTPGQTSFHPPPTPEPPTVDKVSSFPPLLSVNLVLTFPASSPTVQSFLSQIVCKETETTS